MKRNNSNFDKKKFIIENNIYLDFPITWEKRDLCVILNNNGLFQRRGHSRDAQNNMLYIGWGKTNWFVGKEIFLDPIPHYFIYLFIKSFSVGLLQTDGSYTDRKE